MIVQHIYPGAAKAPFGLCFSAAVILAPKHMEKGPSDNFFVIYDLIFYLFFLIFFLPDVVYLSNDVDITL